MSPFGFQYTSEKLALGDRASWVSATDGDTPTIQAPIRMLGMDAPEFHYKGADEKTPGEYDQAIAEFLDKQGKDLEGGLKQFLAPRLTEGASTRQITAGKDAFAHFQVMVKARLDRGVDAHGKPRALRKLFIMVSEEVFDHNGRLLAYVNAAYTREEIKTIPPAERPTFNLQMMQVGHAVSLLIYPNLPKPEDLKLVQVAVHEARTTGKGFWSQGEKTLLPYEFRWIVDTLRGERAGPDRFCGDIDTGKLYTPQQYYMIAPENRLFFFPKGVSNALEMGFELQS